MFFPPRARLAPGRHHSVTVGGIIQESRAALSRYTRRGFVGIRISTEFVGSSVRE